VRDASVDPLAGLTTAPTHVYYFATGPISQSRAKTFDRGRFDEFCAFYLKGFAHLCACLQSRAQTAVRVFYPSSVYVSADDRPNGLTEYAMAKAAGEALCLEIGHSWPRVEVVSRRLPRMQTDQTASFLEDQPDTPIHAVMLAMVREVQAPATPRADPGTGSRTVIAAPDALL